MLTAEFVEPVTHGSTVIHRSPGSTVSERVASIEGAGERLVALAEAAPGSNIDREDVAYELADIGLGFDSDATKTLLDAFDEGDGMIPINHFLDAALAQVAE